jgi:V/A-type H+-transporting ATPase subunit K
MDATALGLAAAAAAVGISSIGSGAGAGAAGMAAIGAWKKALIQDKPAPFIMLAFVGAPLTQTLYGFILMNQIVGISRTFADTNVSLQYYVLLVFAGVFAGIGIAVSAYAQGRCGASASDAFGETGKGFGPFMMVLGICETVAIFVLVFMMITLTALQTAATS